MADTGFPLDSRFKNVFDRLSAVTMNTVKVVSNCSHGAWARTTRNSKHTCTLNGSPGAPQPYHPVALVTCHKINGLFVIKNNITEWSSSDCNPVSRISKSTLVLYVLWLWLHFFFSDISLVFLTARLLFNITSYSSVMPRKSLIWKSSKSCLWIIEATV